MGLRKGLSNSGPGEHKEQCYRGCAIYTFSYEGSMVCLASRQKNEEKDVEAVEELQKKVITGHQPGPKSRYLHLSWPSLSHLPGNFNSEDSLSA